MASISSAAHRPRKRATASPSRKRRAVSPASASAKARAGDAAAHDGAFCFIPSRYLWTVVIGSVVLTTCLADSTAFDGVVAPMPAIPTVRVAADLIGFVAIMAFLLSVLPGKRYNGPMTPRGAVPTYVNNAVLHVLLVNTIFVLGSVLGVWRATVLHDDFRAKIALLNLFGLGFSVWLALKAPDGPDHTRTPGKPMRDFFWGVELYPKFLGYDVKMLFNCRYSMTYWMLIGLSCVAASYEQHGVLDPALVATAASQWLYLFKFFLWEPGYMHSIDIIMDNAGFYETWGVLVYVPALYTTHTRALVAQPSGLGWASAGALFAFSLVCILCNYLADAERFAFRHTKDPDPRSYIEAPYVVLEPKTGHVVEKSSRLLVTGWWGWCRHPQYIFEILTAWSWGMLGCPWHNYGVCLIYPIFITVLLIERSTRDQSKCTAKYGEAYLEYARRVPWHILPGVW